MSISLSGFKRFSIGSLKTGSWTARFLLPGCLICAICFTWGGTADAQTRPAEEQSYVHGDLSRVRTLIKANVLELARSILESEGPPAVADDRWLNWERQLWALYRVTGDWQRLYQRTRQIPPAFPAGIHTEADIQAIHAFIELDQGRRARVLLRRHLVSKQISEQGKKRLRELLIESYLGDNYLDEARIAMENYQSDYRSQEEDWLLLSAQVYMRLDDADSAVNILAPLDRPAARLLRLYARLKNRSISTDQALDRIALLNEDIESASAGSSPKPHQMAAVGVYANISNKDIKAALSYLEQYLVYAEKSPTRIDHSYPVYEVSDLLRAYQKVALDEANKFGFLIGQSRDFMLHGMGIDREDNETRKAVFGYLLQREQNPLIRRQLNDLFLTSLQASDRIDLIPHLYGEGKPFGRLRLSGNTGLALSNHALENGDVHIAARINESISEIPRGMNKSDWWLHSARISITAGHYKQGEAQLKKWISGHDSLTPEQADKVLQPVFDFQTVNQHERALHLLHAINNRISTPRHTREIAYWIAESYQAMGQFILAADYYLFSAVQKDNGRDQWGRAARFRAAESLQSANLIRDSKTLFEDLLAHTADDNSRTQIKQKLQKLWLVESNPDNF